MSNNISLLEDVISEEIIDLEMEVNTKEEAIHQLGLSLLQQGRIDDIHCFVDDVLRREEIESTDMGIGVAIPHGASPAILRNSIAIGRLVDPIQWNIDQKQEPVSVIFLMAIRSENRDHLHLELMSKIATLLLKEEFLNTLFHTHQKQELLTQIKNLLKE